MADIKDLQIQQGKTFTLVLRWETEPVIRKPITGISLASGAPRLTVAGHGLANGWRAYVAMVKGMTQINSANKIPKDSDFRACTVIDADTIEFNGVTPVDDSGREWPAWTSGGFLCWNTPVDLTGRTARMDIKNKIGGAVLASTEATHTPLDVLSIGVDNTAKTITLTIAASATDDFAWKGGVYDLEMVSADATPAVDTVISGKVTVTKEVTT